jgi:ParB family chromosome partitioning protein
LRGVPFVQNDASTRAIEDELSSMLQMRVSIRQKGEKGGEIAISYRSLDDLEEIRGLLSGDSRQIYAS